MLETLLNPVALAIAIPFTIGIVAAAKSFLGAGTPDYDRRVSVIASLIVGVGVYYVTVSIVDPTAPWQAIVLGGLNTFLSSMGLYSGAKTIKEEAVG